MGRQVGHGISPPERHQITLPPQISLSAKSTYSWDTRHHQVPGHRSPVNTVVEITHRPNHKEIKQPACISMSKLKVHQCRYQGKCLNQYGQAQFGYCASVWNPCQKELIQKIKMIQRWTARYVSNSLRNTCSVRIIDAWCSQMEITRIQEDKDPAYTTV